MPYATEKFYIINDGWLSQNVRVNTYYCDAVIYMD